MSRIIKCTNPECQLHHAGISVTEDTPIFECPICHSPMKVEPGDCFDKNWLEKLADDNSLWVRNAETEYPSVIAYEYKNLRNLCRSKQPYGVLLSLKDNFESLLKLET